MPSIGRFERVCGSAYRTSPRGISTIVPGVLMPSTEKTAMTSPSSFMTSSKPSSSGHSVGEIAWPLRCTFAMSPLMISTRTFWPSTSVVKMEVCVVFVSPPEPPERLGTRNRPTASCLASASDASTEKYRLFAAS